MSDRLLPHLLRALAEHGRWLHRQGLPVPPEFSALIDGLAALNGHPRSTVDRVPESVDAPAVRLLTEGDVARCLSCSPRTVRRLIATGALPSVLIGRARRVHTDDLDLYIASRKGGRMNDEAILDRVREVLDREHERVCAERRDALLVDLLELLPDVEGLLTRTEQIAAMRTAKGRVPVGAENRQRLADLQHAMQNLQALLRGWPTCDDATCRCRRRVEFG